jgi:predicted SnoaL-like aldol condensation-catalyzing enzyme
VLQAFDTLFNKRDYVTAEHFWSDRYIQHSAHIPPGRDGLFNLVRGLPKVVRYENHVILAEGDYVIAHGRFSGHGRPRSWIAADVVRIEQGELAEHLGRSSGRGDRSGILERSADVRGAFPRLRKAMTTTDSRPECLACA